MIWSDGRSPGGRNPAGKQRGRIDDEGIQGAGNRHGGRHGDGRRDGRGPGRFLQGPNGHTSCTGSGLAGPTARPRSRSPRRSSRFWGPIPSSSRNRPGSGGLKMTNYAYNVAPKDGSILLMLPDTLVVTQLTKSGAKYESDKFTFLGGALRGELPDGGQERYRRQTVVRPQDQGGAIRLLRGRVADLPDPGDRQRAAGHEDQDRQGLSRLAQDAVGDGAGRSRGHQPHLARLQDQPGGLVSRTASRCRCCRWGRSPRRSSPTCRC